MFKIIVVFWFLRFFINLFTNNLVFRHLYKEYLECLEKYNIKESNDIDSMNGESKADIVSRALYVSVVGIYKLLMIAVDFVVMLSMVKYDPTIVTKLFVAITLIDITITLIKSKFVKNKKDNLIESTRKGLYRIERFSLYGFSCRVINVLYWGYAVYLLFF